MTSHFHRIIGHTAVCTQLASLHERSSVPHALLFYGPSGTGKRTIARAFAALLLGATPQEAADNSRLLEHGSHPDFHIVVRETGKKDISVDSVRELCGNLHLKPYYSRAAVGVIDNAHQMNLSASNALLTTLEEPSSSRYLILVTDSPQRLPETIISRCQIFCFGELGEEGVREVFTQKFSDVLESELIESVLAAFAPTTFGPLMLDPYIDPRTLCAVSAKELGAHLRSMVAERQRIAAPLRRLFELANRPGGPAQAVSLASELSADKDSLPLLWEMLRTEARRSLRTADRSRSGDLAEIVLSILRAEELSFARTLNPQLTLSTLFVRIAGHHSS